MENPSRGSIIRHVNFNYGSDGYNVTYQTRILTPAVIVYATIAHALAKLFVVVLAVVPLPYKQERLAVLGDVVKVDAGRGPIVADGHTRVLELALAAWNVRLSRKVEAAQAGAAVIV